MTPGEKLKAELDYASGWFQYSASQRLTTFNFFLVVVGLILVAYAQAIDHHWRWFGTSIGAIGCVVSLGFLVIDVRNEDLVDKGLAGLREIESDLRISLADPALDSKHLKTVLDASWIGRRISGLLNKSSKRERWERLFKYRFWFRAIISLVGFISLLGAAWAGSGFPTASQPATVSCRASTVLILHRHGLDMDLVRRSEHEGEERSPDDDRRSPDDSLGGDLHVKAVGVGDHKGVESGRHCGKEPVDSG